MKDKILKFIIYISFVILLCVLISNVFVLCEEHIHRGQDEGCDKCLFTKCLQDIIKSTLIISGVYILFIKTKIANNILQCLKTKVYINLVSMKVILNE